MIYFYDYFEPIRFPDAERNIYIGNNIEGIPDDFELPEQEIQDMIDFGAKVQYWLMYNEFPSNYRVITKNKSSYGQLVPDFKVITLFSK